MKRIMIFGAGQAGRMIAHWVPAGAEITGYIDNSQNLQGTTVNGLSVFSLQEALHDRCPDMIWLAVLNKEACADIKQQILRFGFTGEVISVQDLRELLDIRLAALRLLSSQIRERSVEGAVAELGVYQGAFAAEINRLFHDRVLLLFDTVEGFDALDLKEEKHFGGRNAFAAAGDFSDTSVECVLDRLVSLDHVFICKGRFPESVQKGAWNASTKEQVTEDFIRNQMYALVSLDTDLYEPTLRGLRFFYPRLAHGGCILLHDYNSSQYPGVHRAALEFAEECGAYPVPLMDLHGTAVFIKG